MRCSRMTMIAIYKYIMCYFNRSTQSSRRSIEQTNNQLIKYATNIIKICVFVLVNIRKSPTVPYLILQWSECHTFDHQIVYRHIPDIYRTRTFRERIFLTCILNIVFSFTARLREAVTVCTDIYDCINVVFLM